MAIKKICQSMIFTGCLAFAIACHAQAFPYPGQTLQIYTTLESIMGHPEWVLIIRDANSQRVLPYLFDFHERNNFWVAFTTSRSYIVVESKIVWGPYAVINNFCHLESHIITGRSMRITLKGNLSPDPTGFECSVQRYNDMPFPVVEP